jgi:hypothetical protein
MLETVFCVRSMQSGYNEEYNYEELVRLRSPEVHPTVNGRNIPFVDHVKYLGVILHKRITWRLHIEMTEAKTFRTFIRIYSLLKN